eukprot:1228644-Pyramimonas_sp.AAC.1
MRPRAPRRPPSKPRSASRARKGRQGTLDKKRRRKILRRLSVLPEKTRNGDARPPGGSIGSSIEQGDAHS